ncbi:MAG: hypothetical protein ABL985_12040 [Casimicrobium sp.]
MKLTLKKSLLAVLFAGSTVPAFAAVDPGFATSMTAITGDVLAYMVAALPLVAGVFGFSLAVRFGTGLIRRMAK